MPGKAKRKYEGELIRFAKRLRRPLELVVETLKPGYTENDLLQAFKDYYPFEWEEICIFLCGSTAVPEERKPPVRRKETVKPEQGYRT